MVVSLLIAVSLPLTIDFIQLLSGNTPEVTVSTQQIDVFAVLPMSGLIETAPLALNRHLVLQ